VCVCVCVCVSVCASVTTLTGAKGPLKTKVRYQQKALIVGKKIYIGNNQQVASVVRRRLLVCQALHLCLPMNVADQLHKLNSTAIMYFDL